MLHDGHAEGIAVVDVGGVGYELSVGPDALARMRAATGPDQSASITLYVHTHVREDQLSLFGFESVAERDAFRLLLTVNSVGPKLALGILDRLGLAGLAAAVAREDAKAFKSISGVGPKTVSRLFLDLRGKLAPTTASAEPPAGSAPRSTGIDEQVVSALVQLGYREAHANETLLRLGTAGQETLEGRLRAALAALAG